MTNLRDGLKRAQIVTDDLSGTTTVVATYELAAASVTDAKLASGNVMAAHISGGQVTQTQMAYGFIGTGSPTVYGNSMQFGTGTLGAGSDVWVAYPTAFKAAPQVIVTANNSSLGAIAVGSITTGSFYAIGETASDTFNYIAVGSGY